MSGSVAYFSRARLREDVPLASLRALLVPDGAAARAGAAHRLVWTLFTDGPTRERDFLWREMTPGRFYLLSRRPPLDRLGLFELDPPKVFAPSFHVGDRLAFSLRANATVARKSEVRAPGTPRARGKPCDVVMDVLHRFPPGVQRRRERAAAVALAGQRWLATQGAARGFTVPPGAGGDAGAQVRVADHRVLHVPHSGPTARIGVLDLEGVLEVREPALFTEALVRGFGRARAFGCGLMLVRRM